MNNDHSWKFWVAVIASGLIAVAFVLGVLMGRISWPFDVLLHLIGK